MNMADVGSQAVGGALEIGGALLNQSLSMRRQKQAQGFESDMYQRRYQMQVADLKAAGLNPMLAYTTGPGSSPSSSAASAQGADMSKGVSQYRITSAEAAKIRKETELVDAQKENVKADTLVKIITPALVKAQTGETEEKRRLTQKERQIKTPEAAAALAWTGSAAAHAGKIWDIIGPIANALGLYTGARVLKGRIPMPNKYSPFKGGRR